MILWICFPRGLCAHCVSANQAGVSGVCAVHSIHKWKEHTWAGKIVIKLPDQFSQSAWKIVKFQTMLRSENPLCLSLTNCARTLHHPCPPTPLCQLPATQTKQESKPPLEDGNRHGIPVAKKVDGQAYLYPATQKTILTYIETHTLCIYIYIHT